MKIRNGFVSNSSSSSFCIYGAPVDVEDMEDKIEESGLELHYYIDSVYVGKSWDTIKDDETGAQFKKGVEDAFKKLGFKEKCDTHERAWFDG